MSILSSDSKSTIKITLWKKNFMSLRPFWNFRNFWNFGNFGDFEWQFWLNGHKYGQFFFVIFDEDDVLYNLVEFESDRMSPRESAKNGRIGAHGLNCIIFLNSELIFEIYDKNYPKKKNFMSLRHFWNFRDLTCRVLTHNLIGIIWLWNMVWNSQ